MIKKIISSIIIVFILYVALDYFVIQRYLAIENFNKYIEKQGLTEDEIVYKDIYLNYKMGSYNIVVKYKHDPSFVYTYEYIKTYELTNHIYLQVKKDGGSEVVDRSEFKYKPLDD